MRGTAAVFWLLIAVVQVQHGVAATAVPPGLENIEACIPVEVRNNYR